MTAGMKAVVLCAGQGSRLRPLTDDRPKGMVEVGGTSILERQMALFAAHGIDDIVVVGGHCHETIPTEGLTKVVNHEYETTNMVYSLFTAAEEMSDADSVLVSYADILYSDEILKAIMAASGSFNVVVDMNWYEYFAARSDDVLGDAESLQMTDGAITDIGRRVTSLDEIEAQYIGLMKFDRAGIAFLRSVFEQSLADSSEIGWGRAARNAYMTDLLQEAANQGKRLDAIPIHGGWCEIDTPTDLELANQQLPFSG